MSPVRVGLLISVTGCFQPPKAIDSATPAHSGAPGESGLPPVDSTPAEGDTGVEDSGDSAEGPGFPYPEWTRVPPDPDWRPGDPVPGWEPDDCDEEAEPNELSIAGMAAIDGTIAAPLHHFSKQDAGHQPSRLQLGLNDCLGFSCGDRVRRTQPFADFVVSAESGSVRRFKGKYSSERISHWIGIVASTAFGGHVSYRYGKNSVADGCIGDVRPDVVRGWARVITVPEARPGPYAELKLRIPFDVLLPSRSAFLPLDDYNPAKPSGEESHPYYVYYDPLEYLTGWPWDEITDPAIRSALFWYGLPYDWPWPEDIP